LNLLKKLLLKIPALKQMYNDVQKYKKGYPPGHYFSPIVSIEEVGLHADKIFNTEAIIQGIDLNTGEQTALLHQLQTNYGDTIYLKENTKGLRYYFNNNTFEYSDAIFLHLMLRHYRPKRIIEIGSGFSSAVMMDTNEFNLNNAIELTFIEPYPERLQKLMKPGDEQAVNLIVKNLQDVDLSIFKKLEAGDILFVDSTHVSKTGSDVNTILFEILPALPKGVIIHFHDIFYPFEYPKEWVMGWSGFGWNEIYMLRAFLMNNNLYRILLFNTFLEQVQEDWFREHMPVCLKDKGGSLWLLKN
jgi:predicted O-methyltransferase YrrM